MTREDFIKEYSVEYKGKEYPLRTFNVKMYEGTKDEYETAYTIAEESLLDAFEIDEWGEIEEDSPESVIDNEIYHYVPEDIFLLSGEEICEKHLDMPMKFISEWTW